MTQDIPRVHEETNQAFLEIVHIDDTSTKIRLGVPGAVTWYPTPQGLLVKHDWNGKRTVWPWTTVKSYTIAPRTAPASGREALYPGTKFLTLCIRDGRKGGRVTIGESRLPVAGVLSTVRVLDQEEVMGMWPQLTHDEFLVLRQLAEDVDLEGENYGEEL